MNFFKNVFEKLNSEILVYIFIVCLFYQYLDHNIQDLLLKLLDL